jgi:hypothetical protein
MLYLNTYNISEGIKEITITYKEEEMSKELLRDVIDYILDEYNKLEQDRAFKADC